MKLVNAGDADGLFALFDPRLQDAVPLEAARQMVQSIVEARGKLTSAARTPGEASPTMGTYRIRAERGQWQLSLHLAPDGRIDGFGFGNPPEPDPPVAESGIALALPFRGKWYVYWGGSKVEHNQHVTHKSQRRAADLMIRGADGKTHRGDGSKNEDYLAFGQDVLAVADGKVVTVIDGVADNTPGAMNPYFALGNAVIIEHTPKLYSLYAHLQPGKLAVKLGAVVRRGDVLGLCGNSGNSSEPHLHFHLQDGPLVEASYGVEAVFASPSVTRDGVAQRPERYVFLKGDEVEPTSAASGARP